MNHTTSSEIIHGPASLLAKDVLVTLSFHAKMHKLLGYGDTFSPNEEQAKLREVESEGYSRIDNSLSTALEKIEKRQLAADSEELRSLKKEVLLLREALAEAKTTR